MKHTTERTSAGASTEPKASRRDSFVGRDKSTARPRRWLLAAPLLIAVAVIAAVMASRQAPPSAAAQTVVSPDGFGYPAGINSQAADKRYPVIAPDAGGEFRLPAGAFADGRARFFTTSLPDGKGVNFFVVRSSDGVVRAAFDSCDVCYAARKGYHQEGDAMVCNNCGLRFASAKINEVHGGCNPVPLTRTVTGEYVVIKLSDFQAGNRAENGQPLF